MTTPTLDSLLQWMREQRRAGPVRYDPRLQSWQVFGYQEVQQALSDQATYSSDFTGVFPEQPDFALYARGNFLVMDPPRHRKIRSLVSQAFTPRVVARLGPRIAAAAGQLLDGLEGADRFDFSEALANPLPVIVIAELLGIPPGDRAMFRGWADALLGREERISVRPSEAGMDALAPTMQEMNGYLLACIGERRARPSEDLIGRLVGAEVDGHRLDDEEIVGIVGLLLLAGHFTTSALLTNVVVSLDKHPDAAAELRADRAAIPTAIEEVLRYRPSFPRVTRRTTRETELGGQRIGPDEVVVPWITSANRDERRFPEPDRFDIRRLPNQHVSFGHGIHFCVGAPLARLEAATVLNVLFDRYRTLAVDHDQPESWATVRVTRLPVTVSH